MNQPKEYNNEKELIKWLLYDLNEQRKQISKEKNILAKEVETKELVLNIGKKVDITCPQDFIEVNFEFNFSKIVNILTNNKINYLNYDYINMYGIIFNEVVNFSGVKFMITLDFSYSVFKKESYFCNMILWEVNFSYCEFNFFTSFSSAIFNNEMEFLNITFNDKVDFYGAKFINLVDFDCRFYKACFENVIFYSDVNFRYSFFSKYILLRNTHFYKKVTFGKYLKITDNVFFDTYFNDTVEFYDLILSTNLDLSPAEISNNTKVIFDNIIFNDNDISIIINKRNKICIDKLYIKDFINKGKIILKNIDIKYIHFQNTDIMDNFYHSDVNFYNVLNSETARILKNEELKKSNYIKALEYQAEEIKWHKKELKDKFKKEKTLKNLGDIISIELSSLYSDNGQNWLKAFGLTILLPITFFMLSYLPSSYTILFSVILSLLYIMLYIKKVDIYIFSSIIFYLLIVIINNYNINLVIELFNFMNPTSLEQLKSGSYIYKDIPIIRGFLYFFGKISFWYGSVQTVQAFRKFSKGL